MPDGTGKSPKDDPGRSIGLPEGTEKAAPLDVDDALLSSGQWFWVL